MLRVSVVILLAIFLFSGVTMAETKLQKNHPRRAQVNKRLHNENKRINEKVKRGKMSLTKAKKLKKDLRKIRKEGRAMARQHGGHITAAEHKALNRQENAISEEIDK
ncbi:hypothetical protein [Candidatus Magnetominusculus xianensis]|uniref:Secreted protein n=1 Tax=Candidatus Magnetominusculus xianensis TaxID=1748249 RepID=A0ABR5SBI3_9BACT|nr:hypothetical protein [Candidatus Magnetominusculus xianensis]KWT77393.1 hypothetical protein ASN18_3036 [Candidatus Magnetominusculus xianensis]MBF0405175.1 hypothetical protein [Nitrospirota bacterium]